MSTSAVRRWALRLIGLGLTALTAWHAAQPAGQGFSLLNALERDAYDFRLRATAPGGSDPRVVIVDIDEQSLLEVGQWPWPRARLAALLDRLFDHYQVDTVAFDVVFAEAETTYTPEAIDAAQQAPAGQFDQVLAAQSGDAKLAGAMKNRSVVLGYFFERSAVDSVGALPAPLAIETAIFSHAPEMLRYTGNLPGLKASGAGFFSLAATTDPDGIVRRAALLNQYQNKLYPSLALATVQQFLQADITPLVIEAGKPVKEGIEAGKPLEEGIEAGKPLEEGIEAGKPLEEEIEAGKLLEEGIEAGKPLEEGIEAGKPHKVGEGLDLGLAQVPPDAEAAVWVPYRTPQSVFSYISAADVLNQSIKNPAELGGAIVLIGTSAAGLSDLRNTPLENSFPGVEIHATLISALLDGDFRQQPAWTAGFEVLLIVAVGGVLALVLPGVSIGWASGLTALLLASLIGSNAYFWQVEKWVVPIAAVLALVISLYLLNAIVGFFAESRSRQIMRRMFGLYVPPEIVDEMSANPDIYSLQSERREMTVLFSDVRDFTAISEKLSPEELSELLNTLLTPLTKIIHTRHGAIDKYMGDAVMAFWGAPIASRAHATDAVAAALEISNELVQLNREFARKHWPRMEMGIGLSTGEMNVGNMGSEFRMAYTVLGDTVNLGSRLEGLTKTYGVPVIVSEATRAAAAGFVYQELDFVRVKGKREPERIFAPLADVQNKALDEELARHHAALAAYRAQDWDVAQRGFTQLHEQTSRILYALYLQRIDHYLQDPPAAGWDGVTVMQEK